MDRLAPRIGAAAIYERLKEMILNFEIYPGSRITESDIASHFGVSRTPVREALQRLAQEGQISIRTKQGCFVRQISISELSQFYRVRTALECLSLEIAARSMAKDALRALADEWDPARCTAAPTDLSRMVEKEESFHMTLAYGGGNRALAKHLDDINERIRVIRRLDFTAGFRVERTYEEHNRIAHLLLDGDVSAAKSLMADHIQRSEKFARSVTLEQLARNDAKTAQLATR